MGTIVTWDRCRQVVACLALALCACEAARVCVPEFASSAYGQEAAPAPAPTGGQKTEPPTYFEFFFKALGWRYTIAFLIISFTFVAFLVMNLQSLRRDAVCPRHLAAAFEAKLNDKKFQEAYDLAKDDDSMLGQMLAAGMHYVPQGYEKSVEAMQQVGEDENLKLEQRLSFLSLVGSIAPMVGLLGTVDGMVQSFFVIASTDVQPRPSKLAEGISMALITTLVGLILAIPAIVFFNLLRNRLQRLVMECGQQAGNLMSRFEPTAKKP